MKFTTDCLNIAAECIFHQGSSFWDGTHGGETASLFMVNSSIFPFIFTVMSFSCLGEREGVSFVLLITLVFRDRRHLHSPVDSHRLFLTMVSKEMVAFVG